MAYDITKFTNLENWFNKVKDSPYYQLSAQNTNVRGWTPTEKQILENRCCTGLYRQTYSTGK